MKRILAITVCFFLVTTSAGFSRAGERDAGAHHGDHHATGHHGDALMKKLHAMMPMYAQAQARIMAAIVEKDAGAVERETGKVLATIPDLKRARPHKNLKELRTMRKLASSFEGELKTTVNLAKKGDFKGADAAFARAVKQCDQCHAKFRD